MYIVVLCVPNNIDKIRTLFTFLSHCRDYMKNEMYTKVKIKSLPYKFVVVIKKKIIFINVVCIRCILEIIKYSIYWKW